MIHTLALILSLIMGIIFGITFFGLLYTFRILRSSRKDSVKLGFKEVVMNNDIRQIVIEKQKLFKRRGKNVKLVDFMGFVINGLVNDIAEYYFKDSNFPILEITVAEAMELDSYVFKRLDCLFSRKGIRILKTLKFATVMRISDIRKNFANSKIYTKGIKKYKKVAPLVKIVSLIASLNPFLLIRLVINKFGISKSVNMICKEMIFIVAQEANRVYSKSLFNEDKEQLDFNELDKMIGED